MMQARTFSEAVSTPVSRSSIGAAPWLQGSRWDLRWMVGTAVIVPLVLALVWTGVSGDIIGLSVTLLVGGPHLFSTWLNTYLDRSFRRRYLPILIAIGIGVPAFVVYMTMHHFRALLGIFIFAASLHVLQQNAYVAELYRRRAGERPPLREKIIELAPLMLSFYPIAAYKLVRRDFWLGGGPILLPSFLMNDVTTVIVSALFLTALAAWIAQLLRERSQGRLHRPKTILLGVTVLVAFLAPAAASEERMEFAFQSVNAWHSVQYLALVWLVLHRRKTRGDLDRSWLRRVAGPGRPTAWFYGGCIATTGVLFLVVRVISRADPFGLSEPQYYYMGVLSVLLVHYALDAFLFAASMLERSTSRELPYLVPADDDADVLAASPAE